MRLQTAIVAVALSLLFAATAQAQYQLLDAGATAEWVAGSYRVNASASGGRITEISIRRAADQPGIRPNRTFAMSLAPRNMFATARTLPVSATGVVRVEAWEWDYGDLIVTLQEQVYLQNNPGASIAAGDLFEQRWSVRARPRPVPAYCALAWTVNGARIQTSAAPGPFPDEASAVRAAGQSLQASGGQVWDVAASNGAVAVVIYHVRGSQSTTASLGKGEDIKSAIGQAMNATWQGGDRQRKMWVQWARCGSSPQTSAQDLAQFAPLALQIGGANGSFETADATVAPPPPPPPPPPSGWAGFWQCSDGSRVYLLRFGDGTYRGDYVDPRDNRTVLGPAIYVSMPNTTGTFYGTLWDRGNQIDQTMFVFSADTITATAPNGGGLTFTRMR
jgi:hypothetical protein